MLYGKERTTQEMHLQNINHVVSNDSLEPRLAAYVQVVRRVRAFVEATPFTYIDRRRPGGGRAGGARGVPVCTFGIFKRVRVRIFHAQCGAEVRACMGHAWSALSPVPSLHVHRFCNAGGRRYAAGRRRGRLVGMSGVPVGVGGWRRRNFAVLDVSAA